MNRRALIIVVRVVVPSLLAGAALTGGGSVSVRLWVSAAAAWVAGTLLWDLVVAARVKPLRLSPFVRVSRRRHVPLSQGPESLRTLSLLVASAQQNPRVHANALRPRLVALADHYVPIRHGFDPALQSERLKKLLGRSAWLIDPQIGDRAPTTADIDHFVDAILAEPGRALPMDPAETQRAST